MKSLLLVCIFSIALVFYQGLSIEIIHAGSNNAVVQIKAYGRFGDNLIAFSHALYFAHKNDAQIFYDPFIYSEQLILSDLVKPYHPGLEAEFARTYVYPGGSNKISKKIENTLFKIPYFPEAPIEYKGKDVWHSFEVDWNDPLFKNLLCKLIAPKKELMLTLPRKDKISVAVHIRRGGGFEHDIFNNTNNVYAGLITYKFPYDEYFIEQIQALSKLLNNAPLYVFLFTDDPHPENLMKRYATAVDIASIEFDCRKIGNRYDCNVLEDLFSMSKFDMLIRSESNFSIMAEKLGNFSIVISPDYLLPGEVIHTGIVSIKKAY